MLCFRKRGVSCALRWQSRGCHTYLGQFVTLWNIHPDLCQELRRTCSQRFYDDDDDVWNHTIVLL